MNLSNHLLTAASRPKTLTFRTSAIDTSNATVYTFSGKSIGSAAGDRRVIVGVHGGGGSTTLSSATIGGVSATITVQQSSGNTTCAIIIAAVPTGTTADIVVTFSGTKSRAAIGVWSITGLSSNTAVDSDSSTADPATATLDSLIGGVCVAVTSTLTGGNVTWTNVTERYDDAAADLNYSGASISTSGATIAPSGNYSSATSPVGVFATW